MLNYSKLIKECFKKRESFKFNYGRYDKLFNKLLQRYARYKIGYKTKSYVIVSTAKEVEKLLNYK